MNLQPITVSSPDFAKVLALYHAAFPEYERMEDATLAELAERNVLKMTAAYEEDVFCGFISSIEIGDLFYILYFAVAPDRRGRGIGSQILTSVLGTADGKTVFLNAEAPDETAANNAERHARMKFYARRGLVPNGPVRAWRGVDYAVLANAPVSAETFEIFWDAVRRGLSREKPTSIATPQDS